MSMNGTRESEDEEPTWNQGKGEAEEETRKEGMEIAIAGSEEVSSNSMDITRELQDEESTWNQGEGEAEEETRKKESGKEIAIAGSEEVSEHSSRELSWTTGSRVNQYVQEVARDYKELGRVELVMKRSVQSLIGEMVMTGRSFEPITKLEKINIKAKFIRFH